MLKRVGHYILERKIGSGNYGEVYQGFNEVDGKTVSIKVIQRDLMTDKFQDFLKEEIKILNSCQSENIIKLYDTKKTSHNIYMIYEFCDEGDMGTYVHQKGHLTEEEAVKYFLEILNGFKVLVKNNVIHRDLKLANLLKHEGSVKICDFGFSKLLSKWDMAQTLIGTPLNMAPEVIQGVSYNNKADIWSLGIVFYQMLFGAPPYIGLNITDILNEIQNSDLQFPREINDISPEAEDVLKKMLTPDPCERIEWKELFAHRINLQPQKLKFSSMQNFMDVYNFRKTFCLTNTLYFQYEMIKDESELKKGQDKESEAREETASTQGTERILSNSSVFSLMKSFVELRRQQPLTQ